MDPATPPQKAAHIMAVGTPGRGASTLRNNTSRQIAKDAGMIAMTTRTAPVAPRAAR